MSTILNCETDRRRHDVRASEDWNGIDYIEVDGDELHVYFIGPAPGHLRPEHFRIDGGRRITGLRVTQVSMCRQYDPSLDECVTLTVDRIGDFSPYTLCLVEPGPDGPTTERLAGIDPRYDCASFTFRTDCPTGLDCAPNDECPPEPLVEPDLSYLAKDYASFRRLILDRLAVVMPAWTERHVPDIGITLVELFAYVGDYLSYHQDAVATEAYLETARQRISVRRHARLVDYLMHEGCNARAWLVLQVDSDLTVDADDLYFVTGAGELFPTDRPLLTPNDLREVPASRYEVFEPAPLAAGPFELRSAHNEIALYTWGDAECCLPRGATSATLRDEWVGAPQDPDEADADSTKQAARAAGAPERARRLDHLRVGEVLVFEEMIGPKTGNPADADPRHRHAVRLTRIERAVDALYDQPIVEVAWDVADALPFPLCLSATGPAPDCAPLENISVARGNVILVDHGQRMEEDLGCVPPEPEQAACDEPCQPMLPPPRRSTYRPALTGAPLTFSQPLPQNGPATALIAQEPRGGLAWLRLTSAPDPNCGHTPPAAPADTPPLEVAALAAQPAETAETAWEVRFDLLGSAGGDHHVVVEVDDRGRGHLRFGDGETGRRPAPGQRFHARYRVGNGSAGNVGAGAISHSVARNGLSGVVLHPRNPLPATGGTDPEPLAEVKQFAPYVFRSDLQRAVTAGDYAAIVMRDFAGVVQRAAATLRWTGGWYEVHVAVDPAGSLQPGPDLLEAVSRHLYRYRRIGHDVRVEPARYVPLDIALEVCVDSQYLRGHVKAALLELFGSRTRRDGQPGLFHPDSLSFGEGVMMSRLIAEAQGVAGVESATVTRLERLYEGPNGEIDSGLLPLGPLEVVRLDNDPSLPDNGRLTLNLRGGR